MKLFIATPAYDGTTVVGYAASMSAMCAGIYAAGIPYELSIHSGCCYVELSRNVLLGRFLKGDWTHILFVDSDLGWEPEGLSKLIAKNADIAVGAYPLKGDTEAYPVKFVDEAKDLLEHGPTGFMLIKREVIEKMISHYGIPSIHDKVEGTYPLVFRNEFCSDGIWRGEDVNFCRMWREICGEIHLVRGIKFTHVGKKLWMGEMK